MTTSTTTSTVLPERRRRRRWRWWRQQQHQQQQGRGLRLTRPARHGSQRRDVQGEAIARHSRQAARFSARPATGLRSLGRAMGFTLLLGARAIIIITQQHAPCTPHRLLVLDLLFFYPLPLYFFPSLFFISTFYFFSFPPSFSLAEFLLFLDFMMLTTDRGPCYS